MKTTMDDEQVESPALYKAILKSDSHRIIGMLVILSALVIYTILRGLRVEGFNLLWVQTGVLIIMSNLAMLANFAGGRGRRAEVRGWGLYQFPLSCLLASDP